MKFHQFAASFIVSLLFTVSAALSAGLITSDPLQKIFPQDELIAPGINSPESRVLFLVVDFAGILHIEGRLSTIAVGNPDIADASLANHRTVIVTGRMTGTTNLIALDDEGRILADVMVRVISHKPGMVTVRRGAQVYADTCTSSGCEGADRREAAPLDLSTPR